MQHDQALAFFAVGDASHGEDSIEVDGKSILSLTTMAAECGTRLELEARGPDATAAVEALASLVSARFYEDENGESTQAQPGTEPAR